MKHQIDTKNKNKKSNTQTSTSFTKICALTTVWLLLASNMHTICMKKKQKINNNLERYVYYPPMSSNPEKKESDITPFGDCKPNAPEQEQKIIHSYSCKQPNAPELEPKKKKLTKSLKKLETKTYTLSNSKIKSFTEKIKPKYTSAKGFKARFQDMRYQLPRVSKPNQKISEKSKDKILIFAQLQQYLTRISFIFEKDFVNDSFAKYLRKNILVGLSFMVKAYKKYNVIKSVKRKLSYKISKNKNLFEKEKENINRWTQYFVAFMVNAQKKIKKIESKTKKQKTVLITTKPIFPTKNAFNQMMLKIYKLSMILDKLISNAYQIQKVYSKKKLTVEKRKLILSSYDNPTKKQLRNLLFSHKFGKIQTSLEREKMFYLYGLKKIIAFFEDDLASFFENQKNFKKHIKKLTQYLINTNDYLNSEHWPSIQKDTFLTLKYQEDNPQLIILMAIVHDLHILIKTDYRPKIRRFILYGLGFLKLFLYQSKFFEKPNETINLDYLNHAMNCILAIKNSVKWKELLNSEKKIVESLLENMFFIKSLYWYGEVDKKILKKCVQDFNNLMKSEH
ncbi:hypothetical protein ACFLYU_02315 [Candidatus Dependentiae bacterium]